KVLRYLRSRGTGEVEGYCLEENQSMAALARELGFEVRAVADGTLRMRMVLATGAEQLGPG
ncbi:MAG TPA: hypothetical protein PLW65_31250, partial [Pseudomonadota bacterium]|nr:hypothetical protein [Pseudomonadota bacterium]